MKRYPIWLNRLIVVTVLCYLGLGFAQAQTTLQAVRDAGVLRCGIAATQFPFSYLESGERKGFDVDLCRAVATAVLGNPNAVEFTTTSPRERLIRLHDGDYDILFNVTTWTFERDVSDEYQVDFLMPMFYDGQGLLSRVRGKDNQLITSIQDIDTPSVCVTQGSTSERNLADYFADAGLRYVAVTFRQIDQTSQAFQDGLCDFYTSDRSSLAGQRATYANPRDYILFDDILSKEPLSPAVREGDDQWFNVVQWTMFALIQAEEWGLNSSNVRANATSTPYKQIQYMLNGADNTMEELGLDNDAMTRTIEALGNYREIYNRYFGADAATPIQRGLNSVWEQGPGHLLYAPPFAPY